MGACAIISNAWSLHSGAFGSADVGLESTDIDRVTYIVVAARTPGVDGAEEARVKDLSIFSSSACSACHVSMRQDASGYVRIRQDTSGYVRSVGLWRACMQDPTDISRNVDEFTKKRQKEVEEVEGWIVNELHLEMHLVKKKCSSDIDKYVEFRLVHQLYNGGCDSIGRFDAVVGTFLQLLEDSRTDPL